MSHSTKSKARQRLAGVELDPRKYDYVHPSYGLFGVRCTEDELTNLRVTVDGSIRVMEEAFEEDDA